MFSLERQSMKNLLFLKYFLNSLPVENYITSLKRLFSLNTISL